MRNELNFVSSTFFSVFAIATQIIAARLAVDKRKRILMALPSTLVQLVSWANYGVKGFKQLDQVVSHTIGTCCLLWVMKSSILARGSKALMTLAYIYTATGYYLLGGYMWPRYSNEIQVTIHILASLAWFNACIDYCLHAHSYMHMPGLQLNCACIECKANQVP